MKNTFEERGKGSLKEVGLIAWPIVISMLSYIAMGVADTLFVGWLGVKHLAAVGIATRVFFTINAFFFGAIHGIKVYVSQATGADLNDKAIRIAWMGDLAALPKRSELRNLASAFVESKVFLKRESHFEGRAGKCKKVGKHTLGRARNGLAEFEAVVPSTVLKYMSTYSPKKCFKTTGDAQE